MEQITHNKKAAPLSYITRSIFHKNGFTLIELLIVIAALTVIGAISIPNIISLQRSPQLNNTSEEIINILRLAQNKTLASEGNSQYGVYFNTAVSLHQYILFKGISYASRDISFDKIYPIADATEFYEINTGPNNEIVFDKLTGYTQNPGNISLRLKNDTSQTKIIYIDNSGVIGFIPLSIPSDLARLKDSRHVNFNYSRVINTVNEDITLTFNDTTIKTIPINNNLVNNQIYWSGTYNIAGQDQTITIHTLRLNSPDTRFSVFRDLRFNNASLKVRLSGDITGTLAEHSADGLTTNFNSIYVSGFAWQ